MNIKKIPEIIAFLSVFLSIYVKATWIIMAQTHSTIREAAVEFRRMFSIPALMIVDVLALFSCCFFIYKLLKPQTRIFRVLTIAGLVVQSLFLALQVFPLL